VRTCTASPPKSTFKEGGYFIEVLGTYSNQDLQGSLARLAKKLAAVRANGGPGGSLRPAGSGRAGRGGS
jgi:hypothetical protein